MIQNFENKMELQINRLETRIEEIQEMFNKDLEEIKKNQSIMNNAITEIKGLWSPTVEWGRREDTWGGKYDVGNKWSREEKRKNELNEHNLRNLWDNVKHPNIRFIDVPEEDKKKGHEKIVVEKFLIMGKEIATQFQETQRVPNRINPRRNNSRHILITLTKIKHKEQY